MLTILQNRQKLDELPTWREILLLGAILAAELAIFSLWL